MAGAGVRRRPAAPALRRVRDALRILGTSVTQIPAVTAAAREDLGQPFEFITLDGAAAQRRGALKPESFDVYDQWFHDLDLVWPTGSLQPVETARIARWSEIDELPGCDSEPPRAGGDPRRRLFVQIDGDLGAAPSPQISMLPTVHNADGFAILGEGEASSWGALLDPAWAGRVILQSDPAIGALDMLLALTARGEMRPAAIGDLTLEEIDELTGRLAACRAAGQFRAVWTDEAEAVAAMRAADGAPMIGSLWWSGLIRLKAEGAPVRMAAPEEGYRGWFGGLALSIHMDGWARDAAYDYLNWWLDGRPGAILARNGAYMTNQRAVRAAMAPDEWAFWYEGAPAAAPVRDPDGREIYRPGERREGGAYVERMARVAVWDAVMTEHNYLMRRWNDALSR